MKIIPITLKQAIEFVNQTHRHNKSPQGHKFSIGLEKDGKLIGVAIAGRPLARMLDNGKTLEITRVCVKEGNRNACSMLYGRIKRIGQLMGYERIITYTLKTESGASLRAVGSRVVLETKPCGWDRPGRKREHQEIYMQEKFRWEL